ncbi:MAG: hypothetical protein AUJ49_07330 [Desulfovibrionaceae bacterium CG1_02_65_16]|nr:MAG: hypothetical protein AUJ49_07330 [Desulfovibrionaceae bacterium CG1_02_65_16]
MRQMLMTWFAAAALFLGSPDTLDARQRSNAPENAQDAGTLRQAQRQARVTGAKVLAVGVFSSTVVSRARSESVADGIEDRARDFRLLRRGNVVEATLGTGIGLRYMLTGSPKGAPVVVDVVVRHPQMVNPDTQLPMNVSSAQYERNIGAVEHSVWSFDTPGSLAPGEYVIEILYRERVLARQAFKVLSKPER